MTVYRNPNLKTVGILPAPSYIEYNNQSTKIMWKPPTLLSDELSSQNVSIDSRITHYILSFTTEDSVTINHTSSETSFSIELNKLPCNLSFQVAAVNPVGVGEFSSPKFVECELIVHVILCYMYFGDLLLCATCRVHGFHKF